MPCVDGRQAGRHQLYGQRLSQHRDWHHPAQRCRAGAPGRAAHYLGRYGGHRSRRHPDGHVSAWPLSHHQEGAGYCLFQDNEPAQRVGDGALLSRRLARNALGCHGPLQQRRRLAESLSRPRHAAARPDGRGYRRPRCVPRVLDERGLQGTREQGAGAPARALPDEAAAARYRKGLRPETAPAQAAPLVIKRGRRDSDSDLLVRNNALISLEGLLPRNALPVNLAVHGISIRAGAITPGWSATRKLSRNGVVGSWTASTQFTWAYTAVIR